ncbi:MAG: DHA2 family efflux MFS transporter permease subunit [Thermaerobacter sp.]|nr:DHA2 family efflux MFS transporter permease subunit [Thermaerobacter sp.]
MAAVKGERRPARHWGTALAVLVIGAFMSVLDSSIVNIAIPTLKHVFGATTLQVQWVVTIYMLVLGVVVPATSYLADRFGPRRVYVMALMVFTVGSGLSGLAWSLPMMVVFRVFQATGGGLIMPVTMIMVYRMVPRERIGTAMGFWGLAIIVAPALGPTLGGYLVQYVDWRLIFYINVPIGILGVLLTYPLVPEFPAVKTPPFDTVGFLLMASGLFGLLLGFSEGETWGWSSEAIVLVLTASLFLLAMAIAWELATPHPLLNLRVFRFAAFTLSNIILSIAMVALFAGIFYIPLFLQSVDGYGALTTGLIMAPSALTSAFLMPLAGRLYDRIGPRPLAIFGMTVLAYTTWLLHNITVATPPREILFWLMLRGVGIGAAMMPVTTGGMAVIPAEMLGAASALSNIIRQVAAAFGLAILTAVLEIRAGIHAAFMAAAYTPVSAPNLKLWGQLTAILQRTGLPAGQAHRVVATTLFGEISRQAFVMGLDDTFVVTTAIGAVSVLLAFFLRRHRASGPSPTGAAAG